MCVYTYICVCVYIYIYIHVHIAATRSCAFAVLSADLSKLRIHQRGVQWKQDVVIYMMLYTSLLYSTTPIHCTPLPLHPPLMNTQPTL